MNLHNKEGPIREVLKQLQILSIRSFRAPYPNLRALYLWRGHALEQTMMTTNHPMIPGKEHSFQCDPKEEFKKTCWQLENSSPTPNSYREYNFIPRSFTAASSYWPWYLKLVWEVWWVFSHLDNPKKILLLIRQIGLQMMAELQRYHQVYYPHLPQPQQLQLVICDGDKWGES